MDVSHPVSKIWVMGFSHFASNAIFSQRLCWITSRMVVGAALGLWLSSNMDEANHLLMNCNLPAVGWVGGFELELIAIDPQNHPFVKILELEVSGVTIRKLGKL
ncbi:hypothetical protein MKW92_038869 [Papaver armeniacum]|nr:hypothetical protein MKW92_038869 [Papaver armeniacum]